MKYYLSVRVDLAHKRGYIVTVVVPNLASLDSLLTEQVALVLHVLDEVLHELLLEATLTEELIETRVRRSPL
jgi:hypothetical protein